MLVRWNPFNDAAAWTPAFDVTEDQDKLTLEADLPGVPQEKIDVQVVDRVLTVKGERKQGWAFERAFKLPSTVDAENISASSKDGVLKLVLPKRAETKPRQIKVNVAA
jgi:HSP20 family protein